MRPYHWLLAPFFWWFSSDPDSFSTRNGPQMRIPISPRMQLLGNRKRSCLDLKGPAAQSRIGTHPICNRKSTQQEIMYSTESTEHVKILNSVSFFFFKGLRWCPIPQVFFCSERPQVCHHSAPGATGGAERQKNPGSLKSWYRKPWWVGDPPILRNPHMHRLISIG